MVVAYNILSCKRSNKNVVYFSSPPPFFCRLQSQFFIERMTPFNRNFFLWYNRAVSRYRILDRKENQ